MRVIKEKIAKYLTEKAIKRISKCAKYLYPANVHEGFDRNYIKHFVEQNKDFIKGDILEFNGRVMYSKIFATENSEIYTASSALEKNKFESDYYFDLNEEKTIPDKQFDCIIATQVICYMLDGKKVLSNLKKMLKPDGVLILTNSGPIYQDNTECGYMCFYTKDGLRKLCGSVFGENNVFNLQTYGNLRTSVQSLLGTKKDKEYKNDDKNNLSVVIGICCKNV